MTGGKLSTSVFFKADGLQLKLNQTELIKISILNGERSFHSLHIVVCGEEVEPVAAVFFFFV